MRKSLASTSQFVLSRLFAATIFPWIAISLWYLGPTLVGPMPVVFEIIHANIALIMAIACILLIEQAVETIEMKRPFKVVIVGLFVVILVEFVVFSYKLPWADVFADPLAGLFTLFA